LAGFTEVVRECDIPAEHYHAFLDAMRQDIEPRVFRDLDDLIERYIYGSAIVVGYFLAHVYGTGSGAAMADAYACSANLGIALQLTNFCRDVTEDRTRGRLYIPIDVVRARGLEEAVMELARDAEKRYRKAADSLGVFAEDTRPAIRACIDVYRLLNRRILQAGGDTRIRHSVPAAEKFSALPPGKYWRLPLAYLGAI
jgi:phytoene synthase